ncbi:hypothetical protein DLJ60_26145 [Micromonospora chalcea]|uniref:Uncharacterized protein n=2 Tax=Micromonospora TaxID=1873 RepID=A0A3M9K9L6_9ACTN|nr:hypothetical protein DVH21_28375 [Micromonospora aurantiaca]RNH97658.1 hypothetical protein EEZ25_30030 [Micromonospora aurantiaca]RQW87545.1 hypothetical protein DLJ60_26145 [Micromonospora chalcea]RQX55410.1 hypothetical protein DLJ57_07420 [Micromonospora chalcea]
MNSPSSLGATGRRPRTARPRRRGPSRPALSPAPSRRRGPARPEGSGSPCRADPCCYCRNMEICMITPDDKISVFVRTTGQSGSEITGPFRR